MIKFFLKQVLFNPKKYWEKRYSDGGTSGSGSYGELAKFKAEVLNKFIQENNIKSVIDFGCGDGNQIKHIEVNKYLGLDISPTAIKICKELFTNDKTKHFMLYDDFKKEDSDLSISLDVIFHLTKHKIYEEYMDKLFKTSSKFIIIYSSNFKSKQKRPIHVKHRKFSDFVKKNYPEYKLIDIINNKYPYNKTNTTSYSDFFIYKKEAKTKD